MVILCKPKEDFFFKKVYATRDESASENLLFRRSEIYAFTNEKMPVMSYPNSNEDYADIVCIFYPRNNISELVKFLPEESSKKFKHLSYTYW